MDTTGLTVRSDFLRLRLDYHVNRTVSFFGTLQFYRQSWNEIVGIPLDWQRVGLGMTVAPSHKPNPLTQRHKEREARARRVRRGEEELPLDRSRDGDSGSPPSVGAADAYGDARPMDGGEEDEARTTDPRAPEERPDADTRSRY